MTDSEILLKAADIVRANPAAMAAIGFDDVEFTADSLSQLADQILED